MTKETAPEVKGTCFVLMGFGKKTDFETGRPDNRIAHLGNIFRVELHLTRLALWKLRMPISSVWFGPPSQQFVSDRPLHQEVRR